MWLHTLQHMRSALGRISGRFYSLLPYRNSVKNELTFQSNDVIFRNILRSSLTFYGTLRNGNYSCNNDSSHIKFLTSMPCKSAVEYTEYIMYSTSTQDALPLSNVKVQNYLSYLKDKYQRASELRDAESLQLMRSLQPVMDLLDKMESVKAEVKELRDLMENTEADEEMQQLAKVDLQEALSKLKSLEDEVLNSLTPSEPMDDTDIILEVSAGVGGQEAMLFCQEVFDMYIGYAAYMGWHTDIYGIGKTDIGGLRYGEAVISGEGAYRLLKYEGGIHRVQRVPKTERSGRIHTSTVSVAVMPQPSEIDIQIAAKDLKIEAKRASGAGGQHVNTTDSAIRIVHIPTGISVECQKERSQHRNREEAMRKLRALLYQKQLDENINQYSSTKKLQVGTKARSEKIRTYNYPQDRVTDHRIGVSIHNLPSLLEGSEALHSMICYVIKEAERESLLELIDNIPSRES